MRGFRSPMVMTALLLAALAAVVACAGRRPAHEAPSRAPAQAAPVAVAAPSPTPVPVPAELACTSDADCAMTSFGRWVLDADRCYCPPCPVPRNAASAAANEQIWLRLCAATIGPRCVAPMCPRPSTAICRQGACVAAPP
ncbi:MAG TPA: hypothetical protein VGV61_04480 [Thermoanaerobaculia bacterium]|jgi:hypothetical protein|nr:hypothetical protein [Thermoanaerobaculia bacterium]